MTKRWICGPCVIRVTGHPAHFRGDVFEHDYGDADAEAAAIAAGNVRLHPNQDGMPVPPPPDDPEHCEVCAPQEMRVSGHRCADHHADRDIVSTATGDPTTVLNDAPATADTEPATTIEEPARRSRARMRGASDDTT